MDQSAYTPALRMIGVHLSISDRLQSRAFGLGKRSIWDSKPARSDEIGFDLVPLRRWLQDGQQEGLEITNATSLCFSTPTSHQENRKVCEGDLAFL